MDRWVIVMERIVCFAYYFCSLFLRYKVVYKLKTSIDTKTKSLPIYGWIMCTIGGLVSVKYRSSIGQVLVKYRFTY